MAAPSTGQYNLRSNGKEVHLPVELHMAEDSTFMRDLLHAQKSSSSGQVSDNDSSINESDCEALIATSDDESGSGNEGTTQTFVKKSDRAKSDVRQSTSQQAINMQILAQLQTLGSRFDAMEKKSCKKSNDSTKINSTSTKPKSKPHTAVTIPPVHQISASHDLQTLRQDANIQIQVEKRLQELASLNKTGTKLKSLREGSVEVLVRIVSNGPMSTSYQATQKNASHTTSFLLHNGWLALVA